MHGNIAVQRRFSKEFETDLKESTVVRTWKKNYLAEVGLKKRVGGVAINVTSLTVKKVDSMTIATQLASPGLPAGAVNVPRHMCVLGSTKIWAWSMLGVREN